MPSPIEHKTVQARILAYAQEIGWTLLSRAEAEQRSGFDAEAITSEERVRQASLYFGDLRHAQLRTFNALCQEAEGTGIGQWQRSASSITGNQDFHFPIIVLPSPYDQDHHPS
jgi:type I restriction enzyme R subunit